MPPELTEVYRAEVAGIDKQVSPEEVTKPSTGSERKRSVDMKCC